MRKNDLLTGVGFIAAGIVFLILNMLADTVTEIGLIGLAAYCLVFGVLTAGRFIVSYRSQKQEPHDEINDKKESEQADRISSDGAVRCAYTAGQWILVAAFVAVVILGEFGIVPNHLAIAGSICAFLVIQLSIEKAANRVK